MGMRTLQKRIDRPCKLTLGHPRPPDSLRRLLPCQWIEQGELLNLLRLLTSNIVFSRAPLVDVDHSLATMVACAEVPKILPPISVSGSISAMQISGPETSLVVSNRVAPSTAVTNYSFSTIPIVRYHPLCIAQ